MGVVAALVVAVAGCASGAAPDGVSASAGGVTAVDDGLLVERVATGLDGPTQMIPGPDGRLWVAQLAGAENAGQGQVVAVDVDSGAPEVLVDGLAKPTGLAWLDGSLWIATPTAILRADGQPPGAPTAVVDGMPNNGRSNGTLTVTPDDRLLYETSGRERDDGSVEGSGALWLLDPDDPRNPEQLASGLKNAYAHTYDGDGQLWTTEVAEPIGGSAAPDELNRVTVGGDYGWPACVGDRQPVAAFDGDTDRCRETQQPHVTFDPPGVTPTSIVVSPFDADQFVVALWNAGRVVTVPIASDGPIEDLLAGVERPQHLLVDGDTLLVSDHATGTLWRVTAP
ncbi:sorbosone dehydrogenase family protein [soil metagenome]